MTFATRRARGVRSCSAVLITAILCVPGIQAQAPPASLQITIIDGEDALNNIKQRTAREPIVQVEDENHKPVAGAAVVFLLPNEGASGAFTGGVRTLNVVTDSKGQAVARGFHPNHAAGRYQIRVNASYQGKTAQTTINQTNVAGAGAATGASAMTKLLTILVAGAVAGAAVAVSTHVGGGGSVPPAGSVPIAVTPGTGTVGPPR
jgi:hypothetical protein